MVTFAGAAGPAARVQHRQASVLARLGAPRRVAVLALALTMLLAVVPGVAFGMIAGSFITPGVIDWLADRAAQNWGEITVSLVPAILFGVAAIATIVTACVLLATRAGRPIRLIGRQSSNLIALKTTLYGASIAALLTLITGSGAVPVVAAIGVCVALVGIAVLLVVHGRSRSGGTVLGRVGPRLILASMRSALAGGVAVGLLIMLGAGTILVMAAQRTDTIAGHQARSPFGTVLVSMPRPLTANETSSILTQTNTAVLEDRRACFAYDSQGTAVPVFGGTDTRGLDRYVSIVDGVNAVSVVLGRQLDDRERDSLVRGDGLVVGGDELILDGNGNVPLNSPAMYAGGDVTGQAFKIV